MPSGNCVIYKKSPHRPKMANTAYEGHECQVGKGSEEGRGDRTCPYMEHLWRIWHKQGPSSQSTCTIILDKTTKYVMKIIQFSLSAYILKANQIIAWRFFQPEQKLTVTVLVGDSKTGRHRTADWLQWPPAESHRTDKVRGKGRVCGPLVSCWDPPSIRVDHGLFQMGWRWEVFFILLHTNVD